MDQYSVPPVVDTGPHFLSENSTALKIWNFSSIAYGECLEHDQFGMLYWCLLSLEQLIINIGGTLLSGGRDG
jgi:hypothetical protein